MARKKDMQLTSFPVLFLFSSGMVGATITTCHVHKRVQFQVPVEWDLPQVKYGSMMTKWARDIMNGMDSLLEDLGCPFSGG